MKVPLTITLNELALAHLRVVVVQGFEPVPLVRRRLRRQPQVVVIVVGNFHVPFNGVLWLVVELWPLVGEPNGMRARFKFTRVIRVLVEQVWDVLFEGVLRVPGEVVVHDHVIGFGLRVAVMIKCVVERIVVRVDGLTELALFVRVWVNKFELERLREFRRHDYSVLGSLVRTIFTSAPRQSLGTRTCAPFPVGLTSPVMTS